MRCAGRLAIAERVLKGHLKQHPTDVAAIRMLAEVAARIGRNADAEKLLSRALELGPSFEAARHNFALVLFRVLLEERILRAGSVRRFDGEFASRSQTVLTLRIKNLILCLRRRRQVGAATNRTGLSGVWALYYRRTVPARGVRVSRASSGTVEWISKPNLRAQSSS